jgi:tetratricopeptide (TPR) repeat protein
MKPFTSILNFFKQKEKGPTEAGKKWVEGYNSFERGKQHYLAGGETHSVAARIQNALDCFDYAIASGFEDGGIYGTRGSCLQLLDFHLDAIDDFNKAIPLEPEDSNLYYMRSVSKGATGDLHGRVADLKEAIRLSEIDNNVNKTFNLGAKKLGFESSTAIFKAELLSANLDIEQQEVDERVRSKCPGVDLGPDLVTRRRAGARRRTHPSQ